MVPKTDVDSDILANRTNRARATAATGCGAPLEAPGDKIFLYLCGEPTYVQARLNPRCLDGPRKCTLNIKRGSLLRYWPHTSIGDLAID